MTVKTPVYLDHNATTPIDPRVLDVLQTVQRDHFGNPASTGHALGWAAAQLVELARQEVADLIGATSREIVFTSGATEGNNLVLLGVADAQSSEANHLITTDIEHDSVSGPAAHLESHGWKVTRVRAGPAGIVVAAAIAEAILPETRLVSVMAAQNEIGTIQPISEIGKLCKEKGVLFHCDAAQAAGKVSLDVEAAGIDLLSLSSHKLYGPKGVGALFIRRRGPRVFLLPRQFGGGQERGIRPGTINVPGVAAFGEASKIARLEGEEEGARLLVLRERFLDGLRQEVPGLHLNGCPSRRLPGNLNVSFDGVRAHTMLGKLTTLAISSSSACSSADSQPSAVLKAIGLSDELAAASLRIGLGRFTTPQEVDFAVAKIAQVIRQIR